MKKQNILKIQGEIESILNLMKEGCQSTACVIKPMDFWRRDKIYDICRCSPREIAARLENLAEQVLEFQQDWESK